MSRTDQTKLCPRCAARFAGLRCPRCASEQALDLSRLDERKRAAEWVARRPPPPTWAPERTSAGALFLPFAGMVLLALVGGVTGQNWYWLAAGSFAAVGVWRLIAQARNAEPPLALHPQPVHTGLVGVLPPAPAFEAPERVVRRGILHAVAPLTSPVTGEPCVGFRVVGRAGRFVVDDAAVAPFELVTPEGTRVAVLASASELELPVCVSEPTEGAIERVERFLCERGVDVANTGIGIVVTEGVLREGEEVVVEGVLEPPKAIGYRQCASNEVLIGRSDQPVIVRRAPR